MKLWQQILTLSKGTQTALLVFFLHAMLVIGLTVHHFLHKKTQAPHKIAVRTVTFHPPTPKVEQKSLKGKGSASSGKKAAQKESAKKEIKKESSVKNNKKEGAGKKEELLKELVEQLKSLETTKESAQRPALFVPSTPIQNLPTVETQEALDPTYGEILVSFLQKSLNLPEYGEVKIFLVIQGDGTLSELKILQAENPKNEEFLKKELKNLLFPVPSLSQEKEISFTITFKNEIKLPF